MKAFNIQPEVWSRLTRIKSNDKVGTSYLFTGNSGSGKEWMAIEFSKLINCASSVDNSCDTCSSCVKFSKLQHENLHSMIPVFEQTSFSQLEQLQHESAVCSKTGMMDYNFS